nr:MLP-like protein 43 [Tanacetum cinerariifolium]
QIIEAVDEEKHLIVFKVIGGDLVEELYKSFTIILHVEQKGDAKVATWTLEFEKPHPSVPYPTSLMDYFCNLIKDLDAHNNSK